MDRWITELQVSKAQSKSLSFSTEFRHYSIFDNVGASQGINQRIRFRVNATKTYDLGKDEFAMRYGIQQRAVISGGGSDRTDVRIRGAYSKNIKGWKWDPTFYSEFLGSVSGNLSRRLRIGAETDNKALGGKVSFGYFYQHNFSLSSPHYHTLTLGIGFKILRTNNGSIHLFRLESILAISHFGKSCTPVLGGKPSYAA